MKQSVLKTPEGQRFLYRSILPSQAKASVLIIHGLHEHSGYYKEMMEEFCAVNWAAGALDYHGHGPEAKILGDIESREIIVTEISMAKKALLEEAGDVPFFLLGHSLGGNFALLYAGRQQQGIAGLISIGATSQMPAYVSPLLQIISRFIAAFFPRLPVQGIPWREANDDPVFLEKLEKDLLYYKGKIRARTGVQLMANYEELKHSLSRITLPTLLLHGAKDVIVPTEDADFIAQKIATKDLRYRLIPGAPHQIHQGRTYGPKIRDEIRAWIKEHSR